MAIAWSSELVVLFPKSLIEGSERFVGWFSKNLQFVNGALLIPMQLAATKADWFSVDVAGNKTLKELVLVFRNLMYV